MKVGISTACFYPSVNTEDTLKIIKDIGFDLCEVFLEAECETDFDFCMNLKNKADNLGIEIYSVHGFSAAFEPYLFDKYRRRKLEMEKRFRAMCSAAQIFNAKCYVFHGLRKTNEKIDYEEISENMDYLCSISEEYGIKIAWENVAWCRTSDPSFINEVSRNMKNDVYYTLDIKQAVRSGKNPVEYLNVYNNKLINVHINDAGYGNSCLLPGKGQMDLKGIIQHVSSINEDIPLIIELYRENYDTYDDLKKAKKYIEGLEEK
ncbi:Sugar phosphate isomerase/epimerase [Caloramator quimbayensis]|uniref:Sugar phosphate isomerase/epimerase n=1 Tax=Caloramator quimbayensis TaxID=1147123 RepID=A0A1T4XKR7_9CLOT|nr:sugar phosphate isomerase/epimerase [Caloramator quimbayensis]SKA90086.1 Sugar phosphate isomerase/epimerase [Caloramator quimbayensis]